MNRVAGQTLENIVEEDNYQVQDHMKLPNRKYALSPRSSKLQSNPGTAKQPHKSPAQK